VAWLLVIALEDQKYGCEWMARLREGRMNFKCVRLLVYVVEGAEVGSGTSTVAPCTFFFVPGTRVGSSRWKI
jgi:hypothetical protein